MWTVLESPHRPTGICLWRITKIQFNQYIRHSIHYNTLIPTSLGIETHTLLARGTQCSAFFSNQQDTIFDTI
jgi:hypothetical protein